MSSPRIAPFTLLPHPTCAAPLPSSIAGQVVRGDDGLLKLSFVLRGAIERIRLPAVRAPQFADELWRHTCCEAFIAPRGQTAYYEFNFAPSGAWALYAFAATRNRVALPAGAELATLDPHVRLSHTRSALVIEALVRLSPLALADAPLQLGLSAVIEGVDGGLSYWALHHPAPKPDFHHPEAFAFELDPLRH